MDAGRGASSSVSPPSARDRVLSSSSGGGGAGTLHYHQPHNLAHSSGREYPVHHGTKSKRDHSQTITTANTITYKQEKAFKSSNDSHGPWVSSHEQDSLKKEGKNYEPEEVLADHPNARQKDASKENPNMSPGRRQLAEDLTLSPQVTDSHIKHHTETMKRLDQAVMDAEYYRNELENTRQRLNDSNLEKQRMEQEINSLRVYVEEERNELMELRRQQQEIIGNFSKPGDSLNLMYRNLLRSYELMKDDSVLMRRRYDSLAATHAAAIAKLEQSQEQINYYNKLYQEVWSERNQLKHQCSQAIRQWDQAIRERNEYKEALSKVQRQHEEAIKEVNQAMTIRMKATKDLKRLTDERNAAMQEYSLIMSERDSVHKEIEKLQEEVGNAWKKVATLEANSKENSEERRQLLRHVESLKRDIEQSLSDREKALKELEDLKLASGRKVELKSKDDNIKALETALAEINRLKKMNDDLNGELKDAGIDSVVSKGRKEFPLREGENIVIERESLRSNCEKMRREKEKTMADLAEIKRNAEEMRIKLNSFERENKDLKEKLSSLETETRINALQRPHSYYHSHDSAIGSDLQEWEMETIDVDMSELKSNNHLGLDLSGGRGDVTECPFGDKHVFISSIDKQSFLNGKLKVNDCILQIDDLDCRNIESNTILKKIRNSKSTISLKVRRKRLGQKQQVVFQLDGAPHGLTLDLGVYVAKIQPGSVAAKNGSICVGDKILKVNDVTLDHVDKLSDVYKLLSSGNNTLSLILSKMRSAHSIGHLSSSSSGHNILALDYDKHQPSLVTSSNANSLGISTNKKEENVNNQDSALHDQSLVSHETDTSLTYSGGNYQTKKSSENFDRRSSDNDQVVGYEMYRVFDKQESLASSENNEDRDKFPSCKFNSKGYPVSKIEAHLSNPSDESKSMPLSSANTKTYKSHQHHHHGNDAKTGKKKRSKESSCDEANGGTWPRTRGGPVIEQRTGTILHPQKMKKRERLPLSEVLSNRENVSEAGSSASSGNTSKSVRINKEAKRPLEDNLKTAPNVQKDPDAYDLGKIKSDHKIPNPPSLEESDEIHPDDSVKSANLEEKEALERYLKISTPKDSDDSKVSKEIDPTAIRSGLTTTKHLIQPNASGFSPYFQPTTTSQCDMSSGQQKFDPEHSRQWENSNLKAKEKQTSASQEILKDDNELYYSQGGTLGRHKHIQYYDIQNEYAATKSSSSRKPHVEVEYERSVRTNKKDSSHCAKSGTFPRKKRIRDSTKCVSSSGHKSGGTLPSSGKARSSEQGRKFFLTSTTTDDEERKGIMTSTRNSNLRRKNRRSSKEHLLKQTDSTDSSDAETAASRHINRHPPRRRHSREHLLKSESVDELEAVSKSSPKSTIIKANSSPRSDLNNSSNKNSPMSDLSYMQQRRRKEKGNSGHTNIWTTADAHFRSKMYGKGSEEPIYAIPWQRDRSNREELDFTSSRQQTENDKRKLMEQMKYMGEPLIQDRAVAELASIQKRSLRKEKGEGLSQKTKVLSKSHGDSIDSVSSINEQRSSSSSRRRAQNQRQRDDEFLRRKSVPQAEENHCDSSKASSTYNQQKHSQFASSPMTSATRSSKGEAVISAPMNFCDFPEPPDLFRVTKISESDASSPQFMDRRSQAEEGMRPPSSSGTDSRVHHRRKRIRNRSLEMVLDESRENLKGAISQATEKAERQRAYTRSLERPKHKLSKPKVLAF